MKLFGRTGGYYLFWTGFVYFVIGFTCAVWFKEIPVHFVTMCWLLVLMLPLVVPPIGRYFNMTTFFGEDSMWRKREIGDKVSKDINETDTDMSKVVKFPEAKSDLKLVEPPKDTLNVARPPYTLGVNDAGNVQFSMKTDYGSTSLTMNDEGVIGLIEDLAHYIRHDYKVEIVKK